MPKIREVAESVNKLAVPERHNPMLVTWFLRLFKDLQDAIKKGMSQVDRNRWEVPYTHRSCRRGRLLQGEH